MRRPRIWTPLLVAGCLLIAQVGPAGAAELSDAQLAAKVRRLERQLDDETLAARDAAERQLIELGPRALDSLSTVKPGMSQETRQALARIRKALETAAAEQVAQPSLVTFKGTMPASDALAAISQQTGNKLGGAQNRLELVDVDFDKTTFWKALDQVLDQANLTVDEIGGDGGRMHLIARPDDEVPRAGRADYHGIFRFEPVRVAGVRDLRAPRQGVLNVTVQVAWEPRTAPISLSFPFDRLSATDDRDRPITVTDPGRPEVNVQRLMTSVEIELPLPLPARDVNRIKRLRGTMEAMLLGRIERFEFDQLDKAKDVAIQKAGVTVTFQQLRKNVELYEARVRVRFDEAANALESHRDWIGRNRAVLTDRDGNEIEPVGSEAFLLDNDEIGRAYFFDLSKEPADYKFVYTTPGKIVKMPVEFELKDIELP